MYCIISLLRLYTNTWKHAKISIIFPKFYSNYHKHFKRLINTFLFGCWEHGALRLIVKLCWECGILSTVSYVFLSTILTFLLLSKQVTNLTKRSGWAKKSAYISSSERFSRINVGRTTFVRSMPIRTWDNKWVMRLPCDCIDSTV